MAVQENSLRSLPMGFGTRPWLIQATRSKSLTLVDLLDLSSHESSIPEMEGKTCLGCVHNGEWLMMLDESTHECFLLSLTTTTSGDVPCRRRKIALPPLHEPLEYLATCVVLGSPGHPDCTVLVASTAEAGEHFLLHGRSGEPEWTKLLSSSVDGGVTFSSKLINYKGKVYCFASSTLVVIDLDDDGVLRVRQMGSIGYEKEVEEEVVGRSGFGAHLVESHGDLFNVYVQELGMFGHDGVLTDIVVHRLDLAANADADADAGESAESSMVWRTVESIGSDRAFLLTERYGYSVSCDASKEEGPQLEGNCVYLVWSCCDCERLYKFCLDDMTSTFHQILPQPTSLWCRAFWSVSANIQDMEVHESDMSRSQLILRKQQVIQPNDMADNQLDSEQSTSSSPPAASSPPWHDLPLDLLEVIVSNLSLVDRLRFPAVCKSWSKVSNPVEQAKVWPWLMHYSKQDGACKMLDPLRGKVYTLRVEAFETDAERLTLRSSKDGWVVVSGGAEDKEVFFVNPFTGDLVDDPPIMDDGYTACISFSSTTPASQDCLLFGIVSSHSGVFVGVHTWKHGEDSWSHQDLEYDQEEAPPFPVARNNPVLCRGKFYCLGRTGNLGVFDPARSRGDDPDRAWRILDKPQPIHAEMELFDDDHEGREFCYLVELQGQLVSVFMRNAADPPRVFRLDEAEMAWIEVEDINGGALFLDIRASYGVASPEGGHGNRIFFPRYSEDGDVIQAVFYDMETRMYHPSFYGQKQPLKCVWVVPNLHVDS